MVCFVCASVHTHAACWDRMWKPPVFVGTPDEIREQAAAWRKDTCNRFQDWSRGKIKMMKVRDSLFAPLVPKEDSKKAAQKATKAPETYSLKLLRSRFVERFANPAQGTDEPWKNSDILDADNSEWRGFSF